MRVIHVLRKPLSGSVAENVVEYGTGAIHIAAGRLSTSDNLNGGAYAQDGSDRWDGAENWRYKREGGAGEYEQPTGRWPANLMLQHLPGCRCVGQRRVPGTRQGASRYTTLGMMNDDGWEPRTLTRESPADAEGMETVGAWECEPGCPVAWLDSQGEAMGAHAAGAARAAKREAGKTGLFPMDGDGHRFGDSGGVARFFKQIGGQPGASEPDDG